MQSSRGFNCEQITVFQNCAMSFLSFVMMQNDPKFLAFDLAGYNLTCIPLYDKIVEVDFNFFECSSNFKSSLIFF